MISFTIPCYYSQDTIAQVVEGIIDQMQAMALAEYEIILVDDCSNDGTLAVCQELSKRFSFVKVLQLSRNFGQHCAIMAAFRQAEGDVIINMDDDLQTPVSEIPKMIVALEQGFDVVYGRYARQQASLFRRLGSRFNRATTRRLLGCPAGIETNSYMILRRFVRDEIIRYQNPYPHIPGLIFRITKNIGNTDVRHEPRASGKSGYTLKKLVQLWSNCTNYSLLPLRFGIITGLISAGLGLIGVIWLFIRKLLNPSIAAGWTSVMMVILLIGGLILLCLGLLGEYVGRMFISINATPQYVIRSTYNIDKKEEKNGAC